MPTKNNDSIATKVVAGPVALIIADKSYEYTADLMALHEAYRSDTSKLQAKLTELDALFLSEVAIVGIPLKSGDK